MIVALCDREPVAFYDVHRCAVAFGKPQPTGEILFGPARRSTTATLLLFIEGRRIAGNSVLLRRPNILAGQISSAPMPITVQRLVAMLSTAAIQ
jgi:hypothetical protein